MMRLKDFWKLLKQSGESWLDHNATRLAAAVAFYSILSLAPLLLLSVAIAGLIFGEEAARGELVQQMRDLVGDEGAEVIQTTLAKAKKREQGIVATVIGAVTLLLGAAGVFGELHDAFNVVWEVKAKPGRGVWGFLRDKFLSFGMVLSIGFLLLVSLVLSTALSAAGTFFSGSIPSAPCRSGIISSRSVVFHSSSSESPTSLSMEKSSSGFSPGFPWPESPSRIEASVRALRCRCAWWISEYSRSVESISAECGLARFMIESSLRAWDDCQMAKPVPIVMLAQNTR